MTDREAMKQEFDRLSKDERHHTNAETLYWCQQYKLFAQKLLAQPEQKLIGWNDGEPQYVAPPKQWVGLHLDDMPETYVGDRSFLHGARWAEAKLKEKNT